MPIGQLVLEIRGCLSFLLRDDLSSVEPTFLREQVLRSKMLILKYKSTAPSNVNIMQRSWMRDSELDFKELCIAVQLVESRILKSCIYTFKN